MKINPYNFEIPLTRIDPKETVIEEIQEQHPWHWDPMKQDHQDKENAFRGHREFDWEGLAQFAIGKANASRIPEKFWWYDYENERVMHANDDVSNAPIREQALAALKNNYHTEHNTQYYKIANEEFEHWEEPLRAMFPEFGQDKLGISLFIQPPGHNIWSHVDTFSSFIRRTGDGTMARAPREVRQPRIGTPARSPTTPLRPTRAFLSRKRAPTGGRARTR